MQHAPLHARVKKQRGPWWLFFCNAAKNTQWSIKFVPGAMDKIGSMEQIFIMFHHGLWDKKVRNDQFCWWRH